MYYVESLENGNVLHEVRRESWNPNIAAWCELWVNVTVIRVSISNIYSEQNNIIER